MLFSAVPGYFWQSPAIFSSPRLFLARHERVEPELALSHMATTRQHVMSASASTPSSSSGICLYTCLDTCLGTRLGTHLGTRLGTRLGTCLGTCLGTRLCNTGNATATRLAEPGQLGRRRRRFAQKKRHCRRVGAASRRGSVWPNFVVFLIYAWGGSMAEGREVSRGVATWPGVGLLAMVRRHGGGPERLAVGWWHGRGRLWTRGSLNVPRQNKVL